MRRVLSILFGAGFTVATAWSLGRLVFHKLRLKLLPVEHELLAALTGASILSVLIFAICALQLAYVPTFLLLGGVALWLNYRIQQHPAGTHGALVSWPWLSVFALYAFVYLVNSIAPEYSPDGQTYHLGLV